MGRVDAALVKVLGLLLVSALAVVPLVLLLILLSTSLSAQMSPASDDLAPVAAEETLPPQLRDQGCLSCHGGIEDMHPWLAMSCTECHGGDGASPTQKRAHVTPLNGWPKDERVMHRGFDPAAVRFANPADLRVAGETCGECHGRAFDHLGLSLHGTTAGHLNDGLYENGVNPGRQAVYSIFAVEDDNPRDPHALSSLRPIEQLRGASQDRDLGDHFADLPSKACMQCHLWSEGAGLTGRLGQDGLYRGAGCAACHVSYGADGLSHSADETVDRFEPGHPLRHEMTLSPPTETCTHCHVGDASIGNAFQGLAQLYPQMPAGPTIPGTTDRLIAGQFFVADEQLTPADVHHAAGMDCIDCHTVRDVMGDGDIYGAMEHGVEIECVSCHGTPDAYADLTTAKGRGLTNVARKGDLFVLRGKANGRSLRIKQVKDVIDPDHPDFRPAAVAAMSADHAQLECYACHSGWNTNFFGFHFDRNEQFTQLDLIAGRMTDGSVSTQERVFATLRQFVLGLNPEGMVAPYMVGFSSMGTVHDESGDLSIDQGLPVTASGLSGMTMIHHQPHTVQRAARSCIECHRSPATWGLGSGAAGGGSFALARGLAVAVGERGLETLLLDRESPGASIYIARLPLGGARAVTLDTDPLTGRASTAFVAIENAGVTVVDIRNPAFPTVLSFIAAGDARDLALAGDLLTIANGAGGLRVVDVSDRSQPRLISDVATQDARGLSVQWPLVYIADGPGGLAVVDLSVPERPRVVGQARCTSRGDERSDDASDVATLFQYGRPDGHDARSEARMLAVVANGKEGVAVLDVTLAEDIRRLSGLSEGYGNGYDSVTIELSGRYELGDTTGLTPTVERDVAYVVQRRQSSPEDQRGQLLLLDVTAPEAPTILDRQRGNINGPAGLTLARSFNPPSLVHRVLVTHDTGLAVIDATDSDDLAVDANLAALGPLRDVAVEAFAFDRMVDETGRQLKDISHEGARFLSREEMHRVLTVPGDVLGRGNDGARQRRGIAVAHGRASIPGGMMANSMPTGRGTMDAEASSPDESADDGPLSAEERLRYGFLIAEDEPLARMVRAADPRVFDANDDGLLSRAELERLLFSVLDANRSGDLDLLEWPRHPAADPRVLDRDKDDVVSRSEMDIGSEALHFLDLDGDGLVSQKEWPWEQLETVEPVLLYTDPEALRRMVAQPSFAKRRPLSYRRIANGELVKPHDIPEERYRQLVDASRARPLIDLAGQGAVGGFMDRWDIDLDGEVSQSEFSPLARLADRCDRNGDGVISERDRPSDP